jgi:hypothetical protein
MTTADIVGVSAWAVVAGLLVFVVLNHNIEGAIRASVTRWCLGVGGFAAAFLGICFALRLTFMPTKGALGLAYVGLPALVSGLLLVLKDALRKQKVDGQ